MVDIKISELSNVASSQLTDLFEVSRSLGNGAWESRSLEYHDLMHSIVGERVITVGSIGADATTIEDAIDQVNNHIGGAPSSSSPAVIMIQPGVYTEPSLVVPAYVSVVGIGGSKSVLVTSDDPDNVMFTMGFNSSLVGMGIQDATGASGKGVYVPSGTFDCLVRDVVVRNCYTGFHITSTAAACRAYDCNIVSFSGAMGYGILADNGGTATFSDLVVRIAGAGTITNGVCAQGVGTTLNISTFRIANCTNGLCADDGGHTNTDSGFIDECTNAMKIGSTGSNSSLESYATSITNAVDCDVLIESATGEINFSGKMDYNKRSIVGGGTFNSIGMDETNEILKLTGKANIENSVNIGIPGAYTDNLNIGLDVGEGGSYLTDHFGVEIVEYWQYDDSAASGSKFARYANNAGTQLTDEDDAIIVASKYPFSACRMNVNVAANVGSNSFVAEHWNGATWVEDSVCGYKKSDLASRANIIFQNVETQYVETGTGINDDWVSDINVLNQIPDWDTGIDMYPLRFRNNGGSLTTAMEFDSGKVRGDDFDISDSQKIVNWGRFRKTETVVKTPNEMTPDSVNPTITEDTQFSPNITGTFIAKYTDATLCSMNFRQVIPDWADTSSGVTMLIRMYPSNANAGNVNMVVRYVNLENTLTLDGLNTEMSTSLIGAVSGTANQVFEITNNLDISGFFPDYKFIVAIERDATAGNPLDTYVGDVTIVGVLLTWTRKIVG